MRIAPAVILTPEQREALEQHARSRSHAARVVERARIVLLAAEGRQNREIAAVLKTTRRRRRGGGEGFSPWAWPDWSAMRLDRAVRPPSPPPRCGAWCLRVIDQTVAAEKQIHIICDNYATHKHPTVQRWLSKHKHFHVHFTPTSASWLNMIERFSSAI